ncbi:hypothetical protein DENSPDRAFT_663555 [Dentipellis sp. KUC8613]|nr:hypothetical protein DENSPDRAFT_663555 [Dentipellis sp. KUC8613]
MPSSTIAAPLDADLHLCEAVPALPVPLHALMPSLHALAPPSHTDTSPRSVVWSPVSPRRPHPPRAATTHVHAAVPIAPSPPHSQLCALVCHCPQTMVHSYGVLSLFLL